MTSMTQTQTGVRADPNLTDRLAHVRWIAGGTGAGKSTLADILADPHGHEPDGITETLRKRLVAHTRGALHDDAAVLVLRCQGTD
jgi:hypothetical protein